MDAIIDLIPPKIAAHLPLSNAGYVYADTAKGLLGLIDVEAPSLWLAVGSILFNPIYWNIVCRNGAYAQAWSAIMDLRAALPQSEPN
jgi:hypothetical protein